MKMFIRFVFKMIIFIFIFSLLDFCFFIASKNKMVPFTGISLLNYKLYDSRHKDYPTMIAVGSSMSLNLDSEQIVNNFENEKYYNYAVHALRIVDTSNIVKMLVRTHDPKMVLLSSSNVDFRNAEDVVFTKNPLSVILYLKKSYFIPLSSLLFPKLLKKDYLKDYIASVKSNDGITSNYIPDQWGGVPDSQVFTLVKNNGAEENVDKEDVSSGSLQLERKGNFDVDYEQYLMLEKLARYLQKRKIQFVFIQNPLTPEYYKANEIFLISHFAKCKDIVELNGGIYIDGNDSCVNYDYEMDFLDSAHMNKFGQKKYTRFIVENLKKNKKIVAIFNKCY